MACLFCRMVTQEVPVSLLYEDDQVIVFPDIRPQAPVHFLVVPKHHISSVAQATEADEALLGHLFTVARHVASMQNIDGYKTLINVEEAGGQEIMHIHMHVLGGVPLSMPQPLS